MFGRGLKIYKDIEFKFFEYFHPENGFLIRSNVFRDGVDSGEDPFMRSFPELIDIGVMGSCHIANRNICKSSGVDCYQAAKNLKRPDMDIKLYERIMYESKGKVFQVALGGAGDPNKHKQFEDILRITRKYDIVPNITTSGIDLSDDEIDLIRKYCGGVAISFYSRLKGDTIFFEETNKETIESIKRLINANCKVNVHYVISKDTIEEAILRLKNNLFPSGINSVIFILYKAVGLGNINKIIDCRDELFVEFISLIDKCKFNFKIGFDTCHTPALITNCNNISIFSLDSCEAARFSMYIDSELNAYPCSFDCISKSYSFNLKNSTIIEAWNSKVFNDFRNKQKNECIDCKFIANCYSGCCLDIASNICGLKEK